MCPTSSPSSALSGFCRSSHCCRPPLFLLLGCCFCCPRMPHFIDVVVKIAPEGLADATPSGRVIVGGSTSTFRLDQFVNGESDQTAPLTVTPPRIRRRGALPHGKCKRCFLLSPPGVFSWVVVLLSAPSGIDQRWKVVSVSTCMYVMFSVSSDPSPHFRRSRHPFRVPT